MRCLFQNTYIYDSQMERSRLCDVLVEDGLITKIEAPESLPEENVSLIDCDGKKLLLPGFVNSHTHAAMSLLRGLGEETPLMTWLKEQIWPVEARLTPEYIYWGTALALLEMASCGVTCFADMYFEMDKVAEASQVMGMKCALSRGLIGDDRKRINENIKLIEDWHGKDGLFTVQLGPHSPYTVPMNSMKEICEIATEKGVRVHTHFLETKWERDYLHDELGLEPMKYLEQAGLLDTLGTILAHGVWFSSEEIKQLKEKPVTVVHNPNSNLKLGSGVMRLLDMMEAGICVSLGTDGAASNNRLDIWEEMRHAALLHKGIHHDPTIIKAKEILAMATINGARSLGFEKTGLIKEGWDADLVLVDLDKPHYLGFDVENLPVYIVYAGSSADVEATMVKGEWIYFNGEFPRVDRGEILEQAALARKALTL
ncbi:MAG: amidohydrolase [Aminobacterium sp.]|jgi:5-methylthioadenosine/S-adenosylhomocysteine deaminase|nr:amidohydrolase [Aminobacterium sp.]MDD3425698.1 amidohydrolase [Aminobacterium sp.]MDD3706700.1 amidohydrolase [Aminobacterium sp.]MDD4228134.1 amidohydrolase [Aminobacterium sp.]MDD4550879.1 amidohydrolase [Aminobacterium sp.]